MFRVEINVKVRDVIERHKAKVLEETGSAISNEYIAVNAGINSTTLYKILSGENKPSLDTLAKLASYMKIDDLNEFVEFRRVS